MIHSEAKIQKSHTQLLEIYAIKYDSGHITLIYTIVQKRKTLTKDKESLPEIKQKEH